MTMLKADIKKWIEGTQAFEKKDFNGCITVLQQANESSKICFALGMAYFNLNVPKDALYYFGRSVEFDQYLAVGYFMRGVCSILTNDADGAYWDFYTALEKLREHEFIDYTQLKMTYRLLRSEILFNLSLSLLMGGRDASQFVAEARNCSEIHDEQKNEFYAGLQKMQGGQSSGLKPLAIDKSKVFQPPKLTADVGGGGGGGGGSSKAPAVRFSSAPQQEERAPSKPQAIPQKTVTSFGGTPPVSGPRFTPNPQASSSYPSNSSPGPKSLPGRPGGSTGGPGRLPTPAKSLPPPPGGRGGPGGPPTKFAQAPVETIRVKVFYKDKRLVEIPKTGATLSDVKSRVETKFGVNGLQIKYQAASGTMKQIGNQRDLDEALAAAISELYVNKPGEVNEFEPKPPADDWQECYADDGAVYYFNMNTGESSWDPPEAFLKKQKSAPANSGKGGNKKSDWIECFTDDGQKYYYNSKTDESSWDPPS